jgi:hypothetical protein
MTPMTIDDRAMRDVAQAVVTDRDLLTTVDLMRTTQAGCPSLTCPTVWWTGCHPS